jgi:hypothetical protein
MRTKINLEGSTRKALVEAISKITGEKAIYKFAPTFSYEIGNITVLKDNEIEYPEGSEIITMLADKGFHPEQIANPAATENAVIHTDEEPTTAGDAGQQLTIEVPNCLSEGQQAALTARVESKATLLKHALSADNLTVNFTADKISFPWFIVPESPDETKAYMQLITTLVKMASSQKRIVAKDHDVPNEKYAFRCFLLRLDFIGDEYKVARKILLRNLTGSSAWWDGQKKEATNAE